MATSDRLAASPTKAKIVAIGGGSSVGKTSTASALARECGYRHIEVDRTWTSHPGQALAIDENIWRLQPEELCDMLAEKARTLQPQVARWLTEPKPHHVVLEGEGFEPSIVHDIDPAFDIKLVFIVELEPARLRATLEGRSRSFRALPPHVQTAVVAMNALYGRRILEEAEAHRQPWLFSQPWDTLVTRVRSLTE